MNDELKRICKEAIMTYFKVLSQHLSGGAEEKHESPRYSLSPDRHLKYEAGDLAIGSRDVRNRLHVKYSGSWRQKAEEDYGKK
jgi:hypothetical protein